MSIPGRNMSAPVTTRNTQSKGITNRWDLASPVRRTQAITVTAHSAIHSGSSRMEAAPALVVVQHERFREALAGMKPGGPEGGVVAVEAIFSVERRQVLAARLYLTLASSAWRWETRECAVPGSRQAR